MKSRDWISINDRLPDLKVMDSINKESDEVLLCLCGKEVVVGKLIVHYTHRYWKLTTGGYGYPFNNYVTHWQPFVLPKKENI